MAPGILLDEQDCNALNAHHDQYSYPSMKMQGWPSILTGGPAWDPATYCDEGSYTHQISQSQKTEIENALLHFKSKPETF